MGLTTLNRAIWSVLRAEEEGAESGAPGGAPEPAVDSEGEEETNWVDLSAEDKEEPAPEPEPEPAPAAESESEAEATAAEQPSEGGEAAATAATAAADATATEAATAPAAPEAEPTTSEEAAGLSDEQWQELRSGYQQNLEEQYSISDEDANKLLSEPEKVLPRLAAQVHLNVVEATITGVLSRLPSMIQAAQDSNARQQQADQEFFGRWPDLQKPEYLSVVQRIGRGYRQANPTVPREQAIQEIGAAASLALGLVPQGGTTSAGAAENPPAEPFKPATSEGRTDSPGAKLRRNEYEQLAEEMLNDEDL